MPILPTTPGKAGTGSGRLAACESVRSRALFAGLPIVRSRWIAASEQARLSKIEELREELQATDVELSTIDYGALAPDAVVSSQDILWGVQRTERVADICRRSSQGREECLFLFRIVRLLRPSLCLELGTGLGLTAGYIASALELNGAGTLISIEGCPQLAARAAENLARLQLRRVSVRQGRFDEALPRLLADGAFDFAYIDGHHEYAATLDYFDQIARCGPNDTTIVIDDIWWSDGMKAAWRSISGGSRVTTYTTFGSLGITFTRELCPRGNCHADGTRKAYKGSF
jgi:predicted O-methyltransferase YrrM